MLLQLRNLRNHSGVILILVIIVLMVMAIFSVTIFSQSMSQSQSSRSQIDQIVAEQVAKGAFWNSYGQSVGHSFSTGQKPSSTLNGRTYIPTVSETPVSGYVQENVTVSY